MRSNRIRRLVICALFAALAFVATVIPVPVPMLHGYVNIGDSVVLLCAYAAGGLFGALAAGAGCAIADITLSFALYAPATFVIKAAMAFCACLFFKKGGVIFRALGCVIAEIIMVLGYLIFEYFIYGAGCLASVPGNLVQGGANAVIGFCLISVLSKDKNLTKYLSGGSDGKKH
ncbi:MAG: ECF transporter S component [Ruminococcaceae bacterium]|nr:ECF transporter S component [Oscillospiraceae bacterium]